MTKHLTCAVEGCSGSPYAKGYCTAHYSRWKRYRDPLGGRIGTLEARTYLETTVLPFRGDGCLTWPFSLDAKGYGHISIDRQAFIVSRYVCIRTHGEPSEPSLVAAHDCGKGHLGCVNPSHIRWKTQADNLADRILHGTDFRGSRNPRCKLTEDQVAAILRAKGHVSGRVLARHYGVGKSQINRIQNGQAWRIALARGL